MRKKIVILSFLTSLIIQLVISGYTLNSLNRSQQSLTDQAYEEMMEYTSQNLQTYFQDLDALASLIMTSEIPDYSKLYWKMYGNHALKMEGEKVNEFINRLNLSSDWVDKIYILGKNSNQAGFKKSIGQDEWQYYNLPSIQDLSEFGLLDILLSREAMPVYHSRETLLKSLENTKRQILDTEQLKRNIIFLREIENRVTITVHNRDAVVLLVLPAGFMNLFLDSDKNIRLTQNDGLSIWSRFPDEEQKIRQPIQLKDLTPYQMRLELYDNKNYYQKHQESIYLLTIVFMCSIMLAFISAFIISRWVFQPIRQLANEIDHNIAGTSELMRVDFYRIVPLFKGMPLQRKLFILFSCSVILPIILMGLGHTYAFYSINKQVVIDTEKLVTNQMAKNVNVQVKSLLNLSNQLVLQDKDLQQKAVSVHPKMQDLNYYTIHDQNGAFLYSSIYANNPELYPIEPSILTDPFENYLWPHLSKDIFNTNSPSFIKKNKSGQKTIGYATFHLKTQGFVTFNRKTDSNLILLNEKNEMIYKSGNNQISLQHAKSSRKTPQIIKADGEDYILLAVDINELEWELLNFIPLRAVITGSQLLLLQHIIFISLILVVGLIVSSLHAKMMVKPLLALNETIQETSQGKLTLFETKEKDEIGQLAESYNFMVLQIKRLMEEQLQSNKREQELISLKMRAELGILQQQINPHFFYNTLESINLRAAKNDSEGVSQMIMSLSDMLRYSLKGGSEEVSLEEELRHIKNYYNIQKIRLRQKLDLIWEIHPDTAEKKVLKFILQPLVENAIQHGILPMVTGGELTVLSEMENGYLVIIIKDNGVGMDEEDLFLVQSSLAEPDKNKASSGGVGLKNVYQRLQIFYKEEAKLEITSGIMEGTMIILKIPEKASD